MFPIKYSHTLCIDIIMIQENKGFYFPNSLHFNIGSALQRRTYRIYVHTYCVTGQLATFARCAQLLTCTYIRWPRSTIVLSVSCSLFAVICLLCFVSHLILLFHFPFSVCRSTSFVPQISHSSFLVSRFAFSIFCFQFSVFRLLFPAVSLDTGQNQPCIHSRLPQL